MQYAGIPFRELIQQERSGIYKTLQTGADCIFKVNVCPVLVVNVFLEQVERNHTTRNKRDQFNLFSRLGGRTTFWAAGSAVCGSAAQK